LTNEEQKISGGVDLLVNGRTIRAADNDQSSFTTPGRHGFNDDPKDERLIA
jgi:hypothetical protein